MKHIFAGLKIIGPFALLVAGLCSCTSNGNTYYTDANGQKGVNYVGGDKAYQRYRQLSLQQSSAEKEREAWYSNYVDHTDQVWSEHL